MGYNLNMKAGRTTAKSNITWFGDSKHYWTEESLRFTYAFACVDVAIKKSIKAKNLYVKIIELWNNQKLKEAFKDVFNELTIFLTEEEKAKLPQMLKYPEKFVKTNDLDEPIRNLKTIMSDGDFQSYVLDIIDKGMLRKADDYMVLAEFIALIVTFIYQGFNRKSDIEKGRYKIQPWNDDSWLVQSILFMSALVHYKLTINRLVEIYKIRIYRKKVINFEYVLNKQPMSRMHRRMVVDAKNAKLFLVHDAKIYQTAERWYMCRVLCSGVEAYCNLQADQGITLDAKNVYKEIRPCDEAMGYVRRRPSKFKK